MFASKNSQHIILDGRKLQWSGGLQDGNFFTVCSRDVEASGDCIPEMDEKAVGKEVASYSFQLRISSDISIDRALEFSEFSPISVFCGTWNVAGRLPDSEFDGMKEWLFGENIVELGSGFPDVYSIGFQEIVGLSVMNIVLTNR